MTDFAALGLPNESPFNWQAPSPPPKPKNKPRHKALANKDYVTKSAMCDTAKEREELRIRTIRQWEKAQVLRVNKSVHLGAHGGLSKGQKAAR